MTKYLPILIFFLFQGISAKGQMCQGEFGENIFSAGDFGLGTDNILQIDPGLNTDYTYVTQPPPLDGRYTITNNISAWGWALKWIEIGDNGPDSNGYMMVVNAHFEPGIIFYRQEIDNLCENTLYKISADFFNLIEEGKNQLRPNIAFIINGDTAYTTGLIPEINVWYHHSFLFETDISQTSIELTLANIAEGGLGNDFAMDNISIRPCIGMANIQSEAPTTICEDDLPITLIATVNDTIPSFNVIQWQRSLDSIMWYDIPGANQDTLLISNLTSGKFYFRFLIAKNTANHENTYCWNASNTNYINILPHHVTIIDTICEGLTISYGNDLYSQTGIYFLDSLQNKIGCDSLVSLDLTAQPFSVSIGENWSIELGDEIIINPNSNNPISNYYWEPEDLIDCDTNCDYFVWTPSNSTELILTAVDYYGCIAMDTISIIVDKTRKVFIPNAFSPNSDGVNDNFIIFGSQPNIIQIEELIIFNRWGDLVFVNRDFPPNEPSYGWDGKFRGDILSSDIYIYSVKILFQDGEIVNYSGDVLLLQ